MAITGLGGGVSIRTESASLHEVNLVETNLKGRFVEKSPERLIGDGAYDSDSLDVQLPTMGIELVTPHKANRKKIKTQDRWKLRHYRQKWKVEPSFPDCITIESLSSGMNIKKTSSYEVSCN